MLEELSDRRQGCDNHVALEQYGETVTGLAEFQILTDGAAQVRYQHPPLLVRLQLKIGRPLASQKHAR